MSPRDCRHGSLARSCEVCSLETELGALRAEAAYVRGHLESYAAWIEKYGVDDPRQQGKLSRSLREDVRRLGDAGAAG